MRAPAARPSWSRRRFRSVLLLPGGSYRHLAGSPGWRVKFTRERLPTVKDGRTFAMSVLIVAVGAHEYPAVQARARLSSHRACGTAAGGMNGPNVGGVIGSLGAPQGSTRSRVGETESRPDSTSYMDPSIHGATIEVRADCLDVPRRRPRPAPQSALSGVGTADAVGTISRGAS